MLAENAKRGDLRIDAEIVGGGRGTTSGGRVPFAPAGAVDLGSTNGTQVNGVVVKDHLLEDGDVIVIGATSLRYQES